jgi:hypothetical protein
MKEFFLLNNLVGGGLTLKKPFIESEMKPDIYVPFNVGTLMSIGNDRQ